MRLSNGSDFKCQLLKNVLESALLERLCVATKYSFGLVLCCAEWLGLGIYSMLLFLQMFHIYLNKLLFNLYSAKINKKQKKNVICRAVLYVEIGTIKLVKEKQYEKGLDIQLRLLLTFCIIQ